MRCTKSFSNVAYPVGIVPLVYNSLLIDKAELIETHYKFASHLMVK